MSTPSSALEIQIVKVSSRAPRTWRPPNKRSRAAGDDSLERFIDYCSPQARRGLRALVRVATVQFIQLQPWLVCFQYDGVELRALPDALVGFTSVPLCLATTFRAPRCAVHFHENETPERLQLWALRLKAVEIATGNSPAIVALSQLESLRGTRRHGD
jgi:hypothetical protein